MVPCISLFRIGPAALGWIRGWGRVRTSSVIRIYQHAYLKRLSPAPLSHCGRWTLILCAGYPGPPDAPVCGPHQSYGDLNLDISARPIVGLPPLCGEANGCPFQSSRRLLTQKPVNIGNKGREVSTLLEASLQGHLIICLLCLQKTLSRCLC